MVNSFSLTKFPAMQFGIGTLKQLPNLVNNTTNSIVLITGTNTLNRSASIKESVNLLKKQTSSFYHFKISGEPSPGDINHIVKEISHKDVTVIAIGGGSVIDAGKAVSAMIPIGGDITQYLEVIGDKKHPGTKMPFFAIPTTSGTGSEATANAVISKVGKNGFKRSLRHVNFVPDHVILDPKLTTECPPSVTAYSGMDAITQLIEAYVSTRSNNYIGSLIEGAFKSIDKMLIRAVNNKNDIEARSALMYAAYISGIALANSGLGMVHGFASELGGRFKIPHGLVCAKLTAPCHKFNITKAMSLKNDGIIKKYGRLYNILTDTNSCNNSIDDANALANRLIDLSKQLQIPNLSTYGIDQKHLTDIIKTSGIKNNPVDITDYEKQLLLQQCL